MIISDHKAMTTNEHCHISVLRQNADDITCSQESKEELAFFSSMLSVFANLSGDAKRVTGENSPPVKERET